MALAKTEFYTTPLLPKLQFHIPTLWQPILPKTITVAKQVEVMLKNDA